MTLVQAFEIAVQHHRAGQLAEAASIYQQILAVAPRHPETLHHLGLIEAQCGRREAGAALIAQAIAIQPHDAAAHSNLGNTLRDLGRVEEAAAAQRRAIELQPGFAAAHSNLGNALCDLGKMDEAVAAYRRAIDCQPNYAEAHYNLGNALSRLGRLTEAIAAFRSAIEWHPGYFAAFNNLGLALAREGRLEEALAAYQGAIRVAPDRAEAHSNAGNALNELCRLPEAAAAFEQALRLQPDFTEAMVNLAGIFTAQGRLEEALALFRRARLVRPESAATHSDLIFAMHYLPDLRRGDLLREMREWNGAHAAPFLRSPIRHGNNPAPERRLRVGYVSPDLRDHVVGRTLLPVFEAHDREQFEIVCYSDTTVCDPVATRFRRGAALWRETVFRSDEELAAQIRADGVDILVDLALHTGHNRLAVFARKPAPVQISWLGYPGSTGLNAIDYHVTDCFLESPAPVTDGLPGEALRMSGAWCCYGAMEDSPEPGESPARTTGRVTFGSFNNAAKLNPRVLELWARILDEVKESRLLLLSKSGPSASVIDFLRQRGIASERVEFLGYYPASSIGQGTQRADDYLRRYHGLDIALDTFPYNGMTTTCDALWMGVPVVALVGELPISRASFSLLANAGVPELAASSGEDYVRIAVGLARDLPRLAALRATLREKMKISPLLDHRGFARAFEEHLRSVWRRWCAAVPAESR